MDSRDRLVEAARRLFWIQGYEATSVAQILDEAKVNSGSLYHFFDGKEGLLLAVLERYEDLLHPRVVQPALDSTEDPVERVFAILQGYRQGLLATDFSHGCPIGNLALEVSETHPGARDGIRRNLEAWRGAMADCLRNAPLRGDVDLDRLAAFVLSVMEGAVLQARAERSIEPFDACVAELRRYLNCLSSAS